MNPIDLAAVKDDAAFAQWWNDGGWKHYAAHLLATQGGDFGELLRLTNDNLSGTQAQLYTMIERLLMPQGG